MRFLGRLFRFVFYTALIVVVLVSVIWYLYPTASPFEAFYYWRIDNYLECMTPEVQNSIASISVLAKIEWHDDPEIFIAGACDPNGNIYFAAIAIIVEPSVIWHEAAHAYHAELDRYGSDFSHRWQNVKGGVLTDYGMTGFREDVADWVKEIYKDLDGDWTELDRRWTKSWAEPCRKKLQLLREYKFISETDYQKIIEMHPDLGRGF